jgi:hypothetical protein
MENIEEKWAPTSEKKLEIISDCADFFHANGLSRNFLLTAIKKGFAAKENLCRIIGLNEENNFRVSIGLPGSDNDIYCRFVKLFLEIWNNSHDRKLEMIDKIFLQDEKKNKFKVTKLLTMEIWWKILENKEIYELVINNRKYLYTGHVDEIFITHNKDITADFMRKWNIWYGEQIKSNTTIVISANPLDFFKASTDAAFTSCYHITGGSFNGCISSWLSADTLITSVEELSRPGYKIGRSWLYATPSIVIVARRYGSIREEHHLHIRNFVTGKFGGKWTHKQDERIDGSRNVIFKGPGYLDNGTGDITVCKDAEKKVPYIPLAICMYCGKEYKDNGSRGICGSCAKEVSSDNFSW